MALAAGDLDRRVRLERLRLGNDDHGGDLDAGDPANWQHLGDRWAKVVYARQGAEQPAAGQLQAVVSAAFSLRRDSLTRTLTPKDRLRFDDAASPTARSPVWNIISAVPADRDEIAITAALAGEQPAS